ncbi:unnamed protein product [Choristocarpus tenellus]
MHLLQESRGGGAKGRSCAVTLAKACKSNEVRRIVRGHKFLGELVGALFATVNGSGPCDEALLYCLTVTIFLLSKDPLVAKTFPEFLVATLASLVQGCSRTFIKEVPKGPHRCAPQKTSMRRGGLQTKRSSRRQWGTDHPDHVAQIPEKGIFDFESEDEERHENKIKEGDKVEGRKSCIIDGDENVYGRSVNGGGNDHSTIVDFGSTDDFVQARMLLDLCDMLPWGLANRHIVSYGDLALAALFNVAATSRPDAGDENDEGSLDTPGSNNSQHDWKSNISNVEAKRQSIASELSRPAPHDTLVTLVSAGIATLERLTKSDGHGLAAGEAPQSSLHRLFLSLKLLDLATLNRPTSTLVYRDGGGTDLQVSRARQRLELVRVGLAVAAHCQVLLKRKQPTSCGSPSALLTVDGGNSLLGEEVATRVQDCMLAAFHVVMNVTHQDPQTCSEAGAQGGLDTLLACVVQGEDWSGLDNRLDDSPTKGFTGKASLLSFPNTPMGGKGSGGENVMAPKGQSSGRSNAGNRGGDFDTQVLALGALINCIELEESAENRSAIEEATLCTGLNKAAAGPGHGASSERYPAPELLARFMINHTRAFYDLLGPGSTEGVRGRDKAADKNDKEACGVAREVAEESAEPKAPAALECVLGDEDFLSRDEGAELVLGGHSALLLGLLIRHQKRSR